MHIRKLLFGAFLTVMAAFSMPAQAQFEGQIIMKAYGEEDGRPTTNELNLYAAKDRIIIKGENSMSFMDDSYDASGLLIRNDKKDFIILMDNDQALQFTKEELEGFFSMAAMMSGDDAEADVDTDDMPSLVYTNRTKVIRGYDCTELKVTDKENGNSMSIWLTGEIKLNWGMLAEPWKNVPVAFQDPATRITQEFKSSSFPMMIEIKDEGEWKTIFEVTDINESSIAKAMVEIPTGIKLVSLGDMLFGMMMKN